MMLDRPPLLPMLIASGFGVGFSPIAPGTVGAIFAICCWLGLSLFFSASDVWWLTMVVILFFVRVGIWAANRLQPYWGEDPSQIVVDEMVGMWIPLLIVPIEKIEYILMAFLLFRFFDIVKPLGIRKMEYLPGGVGVMLDDVLSGIYSFIVLIVIRWIIA